MSMTRWIGLAVGLLISSASWAAATGTGGLINQQDGPWQPAAPGVQIPLWPEGLSIARPVTPGKEVFGTGGGKIANLPVTIVQLVSRPTMTIYPPKGQNTGAAVLVFPGGGYRVLAIDLEGTEICDWLTAKGITCAVLKYRVPGSGPYWNDECNCRRIPAAPMALQDAQRAMGLLRERAATLGVDPHRIGVVGFSAGGRMVADISNHAKRSYPPIDAADQQSSRPDFAMAMYPGHLWKEPGLTLDPGVKIDPACPPTFIVQAEDDATDDVRESLTYYLALQQAKIPVEMHLYAKGGHAFGVRRTPNPITHWTELAEQWMSAIGMVPAQRRGG
ncbi:alpha/beta hydrolase [Dyella sp. 20L07]|uniref:alpha/beta hydrolase n=1 Tax=Dyella sp. 20L07 TaxID=3384240 RepID=UPI003D2C20DE